MKRAFALARRGEGKTSPNPMVGAVLVKDGRIIGEGWHRRHGALHAEAEAVKAALDQGISPEAADLYCTLEPCCFTAPEKHQPPCTGLITKHGIKRVYIANLDPNPKVSGKGVDILTKAGITVSTGLCAAMGEDLNRAFFTFHRLHRPYIHLKMAQTLDGRIAAPDGSSRWITDEAARRMVHRLRACYDAVLVGSGTALADDPELTVRLVKGRNPHRIILDSHLALPLTAKVLSALEPEKNIIIHSDDADERKAGELRSFGVKLIPVKKDHGKIGISLHEVLKALAELRIQSVLVEGGARVYSSFLREGLWDRLWLFTAPIMIGGGVSAVADLGLTSMGEALRFNGTFRHVAQQTLFEADRVDA